ncbi:hypothetical protein D9M68_135960 [compost metagenome]
MPLLRTPEDIPADESPAEFQERFVNVGPTIEANAKTAEVMKPGVSPFNHPAEFSQATAVFGAAPRNHRLDTALAQSLAMRVGIVATISKDDLGLLKRPAARAADRNYRIDERQQLRDIVAVGAGQDGTDGDAIGIDEDMVLGTRPRAISGVRTCFSPAPTARSTRNRLRRTRGRSGRPRAACRAAIRVVGPTRLLPVAQMPPAGCARTEAQPGRQVVPPQPGLQHEQNAIERGPIRYARATWMLLAPRLWRWQ